jgi:hydroxymethylpyrimidine/phosphomethylpyrimidine kinase
MLKELPAGTPVVVDPVMVAESGARLLDPEAQGALVREIIPHATVLTPNLVEARVLVDREPGFGEGESEEAEALARALLALGASAVVVTGGHRVHALDVFMDSADRRAIELSGERHRDGAAHGSGCTHSSLLAAHLALGWTPLEAARRARALAGEAVGNGLRDIGEGPGPVDVVGLGPMRSL